MANEDLDWYARLKQDPDKVCFVVVCPKCLLNVSLVGQPEDTKDYCLCEDTVPVTVEEIVKAHGLELFASIFTPTNLATMPDFNKIAERA